MTIIEDFKEVIFSDEILFDEFYDAAIYENIIIIANTLTANSVTWVWSYNETHNKIIVNNGTYIIIHIDVNTVNLYKLFDVLYVIGRTTILYPHLNDRIFYCKTDLTFFEKYYANHLVKIELLKLLKINNMPIREIFENIYDYLKPNHDDEKIEPLIDLAYLNISQGYTDEGREPEMDKRDGQKLILRKNELFVMCF